MRAIARRAAVEKELGKATRLWVAVRGRHSSVGKRNEKTVSATTELATDAAQMSSATTKGSSKSSSVTATRKVSFKPSSPNSSREEFYQEIAGLGSAAIVSHYERPGLDVPVPSFLVEPKTVSVLGAPMSWGQPRAGTDMGCHIMRESGLEKTLIGLDWRIDDQGDLAFDPPKRNDPKPKGEGNAKNCFCVGRGLQKIHNAVYASASKGEFALTLGGDHSIGAGTVSGILKARPDTGIIWVDAHGDLNTPGTSPSGNMHGMPLGFLMGHANPADFPGWEWLAECPTLRPEQLVFVGLRDLDDGERKSIKEHHIKAFTMFDVDRFGIGKVMQMAISHLEGRPLHLSYDIDAVDPEYAPSTGTIVRGGLNYREAHYVAEAVGNTGMLGSMDIVEVNPKLTAGPESEATANLAMALVASAMGSRIL